MHLNSAPQGERPRHPHDIRQRAPRHELCTCILCQLPLPALLLQGLECTQPAPCLQKQAWNTLLCQKNSKMSPAQRFCKRFTSHWPRPC